jgi:hypothetical protein
VSVGTSRGAQHVLRGDGKGKAQHVCLAMAAAGVTVGLCREAQKETQSVLFVRLTYLVCDQQCCAVAVLVLCCAAGDLSQGQ